MGMQLGPPPDMAYSPKPLRREMTPTQKDIYDLAIKLKNPDLTMADIKEILIRLGFAEPDIDRALFESERPQLPGLITVYE